MPGEFSRIIFVERFVHKSGTTVCISQHPDTLTYFTVIVRSKCTHNNTHRPNHIVTDMRATDSFACFSFEKERIILTPDQFTGIPVNRIFRRDSFQIGHRQQTRHIGIVHKVVVTEAIDLKGIYFPIFRMVYDSIFMDSGLHFVGQSHTL